MTEFTPEVDLTIFPRINFLKTFGPRLEQRDLNGRVYWIDGAPGPFDDAALHLNFAESKSLIDDVSGQNLVTFTRASTATYTDDAGVIQTAAIDEARFDHAANGTSLGLLIEEARTNSLTYSGEFDNAAWTKTRTTIVPNAITAPDGTITADKLIRNTDNNINVIYQTVSLTQTTYTFSVFAKQGEYGFCTLVLPNAQGWDADRWISVDLTDGSFAVSPNAPTATTVQEYPGGWYRISITHAASATVTRGGYIDARSSSGYGAQAGDGTSGIYIWGAQLEAGPFPTSYIPTLPTFTSRASTATYYDASGVIQTAGVDVARDAAYLPDENGVFRPTGLLLEGARTNLLTYSEEFDNASWIKGNVSITANSTTAPDGTSTADTLNCSTGGQTFQHTRKVATTTAASYTFSCFVKAGNISTIRLGGESYAIYATFDLTGNGSYSSVTTGASASIASFPNGWYRCTLTYTASAGTYVNDIRFSSAALNDYVYIWGAQLEQGSFPTSYIPTAGATVTRAADVSSSSTVTRAADVASITGTNFSSWYNQSEGAILAEVYPVNPTQGGVWGPINSGGIPLGQGFVMQASKAQLRIVNYLDSGSSDNDIVFNSPLVGGNKWAIAGSISDDTTGAYFNGSTGKVNASRAQGYGSVAGVTLGIHAGQRLTGHISRLAYFNTRLPDSNLISLTS